MVCFSRTLKEREKDESVNKQLCVCDVVTMNVILHKLQPGFACLSQVLQLGGIPDLVSLLRSPNAGVSQAAAGALRNLVFKHQHNKLEVQHCGGIAKALQLLKETNSTDTQKQITGRTFSRGQHFTSLKCVNVRSSHHKVYNNNFCITKGCCGTCHLLMT